MRHKIIINGDSAFVAPPSALEVPGSGISTNDDSQREAAPAISPISSVYPMADDNSRKQQQPGKVSSWRKRGKELLLYDPTYSSLSIPALDHPPFHYSTSSTITSKTRHNGLPIPLTVDEPVPVDRHYDPHLYSLNKSKRRDSPSKQQQQQQQQRSLVDKITVEATTSPTKLKAPDNNSKKQQQQQTISPATTTTASGSIGSGGRPPLPYNKKEARDNEATIRDDDFAVFANFSDEFGQEDDNSLITMEHHDMKQILQKEKQNLSLKQSRSHNSNNSKSKDRQDISADVSPDSEVSKMAREQSIELTPSSFNIEWFEDDEEEEEDPLDITKPKSESFDSLIDWHKEVFSGAVGSKHRPSFSMDRAVTPVRISVIEQPPHQEKQQQQQQQQQSTNNNTTAEQGVVRMQYQGEMISVSEKAAAKIKTGNSFEWI